MEKTFAKCLGFMIFFCIYFLLTHHIASVFISQKANNREPGCWPLALKVKL